MKTLNLGLLAGIVTQYGQPLYPATPTTEAGSVAPGEYTLDGNTLVLVNEGITMYIPIRTSRIEQGVDATQTFNIGIFTASRDAQGEYNGSAWSVKAGSQKAFAY